MVYLEAWRIATVTPFTNGRMMNYRKLSAALAVATIVSACSEQPVATAPNMSPSFSVSAGSASGRYLVAFTASIPASFASEVAAVGGKLDASLAKFGGAIVSNIDATAAARLSQVAGVQSIDADPMFKLDPVKSKVDASDASLLDLEVASPTAPATAGLYAMQWNMRAINAPAAWNAGKLGSSSVRIGIIDTGIDEGTAAAGIGRNNDLLNRVDRVLSKSFMPVEDTIVQRLFPGAPLYTDLDGHGTNVASQVSSNAINFAGVTSQTKLVSLKACTILPVNPADTVTAPGYCSTSAVFAALAYAVENNIDLVNMSLGGGFMKRDCQGCTSIFNRIVGSTTRAGLTIVVAAGNSGIDLDHDGNFYSTYCSVPGVICVGATGPTSSGAAYTGPFPNVDASSIYTNFGRSSIDVMAPGGNYSVNAQNQIIGVSYVWSLCPRRTAAAYSTTLKVSVAVGPCGAWGFLGTSQASPHVAGLAALLIEKFGRNPGAIERAIEASADQLSSSSVSAAYGNGRINVGRALGL